METPANLRYARSHEWVRIEGGTAYVGISDYAQQELGDVVYVEAAQAGRAVKQGDEVATVESVKAASAIYAPLSGRILEANHALEGAPELLNRQPYEAWLFTLEPADPKELDGLMDADAYRRFLDESGGTH